MRILIEVLLASIIMMMAYQMFNLIFNNKKNGRNKR